MINNLCGRRSDPSIGRRAFLVGVAAIIVTPLVGEAQQAAKVYRPRCSCRRIR